MIPQGSQLLNTTQIANLTNAVNSASSCAELQELVTQAFASLRAIKQGINSELAAISPMLALLSPPSASPTAIVTWLSSFINNFLTPQMKPSITYAAQLTALAAQITSLTSAINTASSKFPSCSISIPTI